VNVGKCQWGGYHIWQVNYKFFFLGACKFPCQIEDDEMLNQQACCILTSDWPSNRYGKVE
jgi:hypothetical protein